MTTQIPFQFVDNSVVIRAEVNGHPTDFILDTGDAIGPVFDSVDAQRLALEVTGEIGIAGASGAGVNYSTVATIKLGDLVYADEPSAIDPELPGNSLLGLPFFAAKADSLTFDFAQSMLTVVAKEKAAGR